MFTRDEDNCLRFLDLRISDWPVMIIAAGMFISPLVLLPFTGWSLIQGEIAFATYSPIAFLGIRQFYQLGRSRGKPLDWDRLPEVLPGLVRGKIFTREEAAIKIYDLFCYSADPLERQWDLKPFAPIPPKQRRWFLEGNNESPP